MSKLSHRFESRKQRPQSRPLHPLVLLLAVEWGVSAEAEHTPDAGRGVAVQIIPHRPRPPAAVYRVRSSVAV